MKYVFVKDAEGYVFKKPASAVESGETVISETEYREASGLAYYEKKFGHGGVRENAGRKFKYDQPLNIQMRVTQDERDFLLFARSSGFDYRSFLDSETTPSVTEESFDKFSKK